MHNKKKLSRQAMSSYRKLKGLNLERQTFKCPQKITKKGH
jgi:hypothetical protein